MSSTVFTKYFKSLLNEAELPPPEEELPSPESDDQALQAGLDADTDPGAFNDVPANPEGQIQANSTTNSIDKLNQWIVEIEQFIEYLNGLSPSSMNYELNRADCSSIMSDVQRSESKKISRVAQDLSSLSEALKQYLLGAERKAREDAETASPSQI